MWPEHQKAIHAGYLLPSRDRGGLGYSFVGETMLLLYLITVLCLLILIGAAVGIRRAIVRHGQPSPGTKRDEEIRSQS